MAKPNRGATPQRRASAARPPGPRALFVADVHQAVEERAGGDDEGAAGHGVAFFERESVTRPADEHASGAPRSR